MTFPNSPEGWAIKLSQLLSHVHKAQGTDPFPVKIKELAADYSALVFPETPISLIQGDTLPDGFEGMLTPNPNGSGEWGIFYNNARTSKGRINFTLAHEFGHYLLHRDIHPSGLQCTAKDMRDWRSEYGQIEAQANTFASFFLMPLDDFRKQIKGQKPSLDLMRHLSNRYESSLTATILKWLSITDQKAMLVVANDGYIDWSWSSDPLIRSGIYYKARQEVTELPANSLAASLMNNWKSQQINFSNIKHKAGVWLGNEEVEEMTQLYRNGTFSISLLIYPKTSAKYYHNDAPNPQDSYDKFSKF